MVFNSRERLPRKIAQNSYEMIFDDRYLLSRERRNYARAERNAFREVTEHRVLRLQHFPFFAHIRYLEYKLFAAPIGEQKVSIALTRQFARARLNTEILLSYSWCEIIHDSTDLSWGFVCFG